MTGVTESPAPAKSIRWNITVIVYIDMKSTEALLIATVI